MADENYVEIGIRAKDDGASAELDDIKLKIDELRNKIAEMRVGLKGDDETMLRLDRLDIKLTRLGEKVARPDVAPEGIARTEAELSLVEHSMDKINRQSAGAGARGVISKFLNGAAGNVPGGPAGLAGIAAGITILAGQITSILGPLAAAGIGIGAFAALAIPAIRSVTSAYSGITTAQSAYSQAVARQKLDPTTANAQAAKTALDNLKLAWQNLDPVTRSAVRGIQGISSEFSGLAQRIAPEVLKIFNDLLPGIHQLIGDLGPFAAAIGPVLDKMAKSFSQFTTSAGFKQFLDSMLKISPQAVLTIGEGLAKIAIAIGKVLEASAKGNGLKDLARDFGILARTVQVLGDVLVFLAKTSEANIGIVIRVIKDLIEAAKNLYRWWIDAWHFIQDAMSRAQSNISGQISIVIGWIKTAGQWVARVFGTDIPHWIGVAVQWFQQLPGKILGAVSNFGSLLYSAGQALLQGLIGGIESVVGSVIHTVESVGSGILGAIKHALGIGSPSKEGIAIGANFGDSIVMGMLSRTGRINTAARGLGTAALTGGAGGFGAGAGGAQRIIIDFNFAGGDDDLVRLMRRAIRVRGGSQGTTGVQNVLAQRW